MSKSAIFTENTQPLDVVDRDLLPVGRTVRRYGNCILADENTITVCGCNSYYLVNATIVLSGAGDVTVSLQQDGVDVAGASVTIGGGGSKAFPIVAIVRNTCDYGSRLSFVIRSAAGANLETVSATVVKL